MKQRVYLSIVAAFCERIARDRIFKLMLEKANIWSDLAESLVYSPLTSLSGQLFYCYAQRDVLDSLCEILFEWLSGQQQLLDHTKFNI